jgi:protein phosphatase
MWMNLVRSTWVGALASSENLRVSQAQQIPEAASLLESYRQRGEAAERYVDAYRQYCWTVNSLADLKLAPFHLLASEGVVHTSKDHIWHMETLAGICKADPELLLATRPSWSI